ncbi:MAG: hypothetical protein ACKVWR_05685 [Acidimicrobiales bacterium]
MPGAEPALLPLAPGVFAWLQLPGAHGQTNAGVVVEADGVTVLDTLMVERQWAPFAEAVEALERPVRRMVLSSSHVQFAGGTARFWQAACYGSDTASEQLDLAPNVAGYRLLMPEFADELADDLRTRPVSHTVSVDAWLTPAIELLVRPGQQRANVAVHVPGADVVFAGALCSFGVTPLAFDGDPAAWAETVAELAGVASTIVPGHGPVGGPDDALALAAYLQACVDAAGDPGGIPPGPWDAWSRRDLDVVNVERAALLARGEDRPPTSLLRMIGLA